MFATYATEGRQGPHRFFATSMRWGELDQALVFHDDLEELDEDHRMQRGLAKSRLSDLKEYLIEVPDHFFSALTLVILPRDLERRAAEGTAPDDDGDWDYLFVRDGDSRLMPGQQRVGVLYLSGEVRLFPADGQHRAKSGRLAIKELARLSKEEVPVVLVPYESPDQVRQLFSDLNLNAKPVSKTIGYDFETRKPIAIASKAIGRDVHLFRGRVNRVSNSLPRSSANVITLNTLVQGTQSIAAGIVRRDNPSISDRSVDSYVEKYLEMGPVAVQEMTGAWGVIVDSLSGYWADVLDGVDGAPGALRENYLFPHGLGWLALAVAAGQLIGSFGDEWEARFRRAVRSFNWERSAPSWAGTAVIHDPDGGNRINNTGPAVRALARMIVEAAQ